MINKTIQFIRQKIISSLKTADIKSAEIDAQILLEFVTGKSREFLLTHPEYRLSDKQIRLLGLLTDRRKTQEPIAYIIGHKEFYGLDFEITKDVLIPRPETELLVEETIKFISTYCSNQQDENYARPLDFSLRSKNKIRILDMGTGSGNIIISIAKTLNNTPYGFVPIGTNQYFFASDISTKALKVAMKNAQKHRVEKQIKFIQSDLFDNISGKFDLIIANLPYVPTKSKKSKVKSKNEEIDFEPQNAIFAEDNGMEIIKKFLDQAKNRLNKNGLILIEVDERNAKSLATYAAKLFASVDIIKDYSNKLRFLKIS